MERIYEGESVRNIQKKFDKYKKKWIKETVIISSAQELVENKNYQAIIKMGMPVVPIILKDMVEDPNWWFWALMEITGEDPTTEEIHGNLNKMTYAWLKWGEGKEYS